MQKNTFTTTASFSDLIDSLQREIDDSPVELEKEEWLSPTQISKELGLHINTIYRFIRAGQFPVYDLTTGGKYVYRVKRSDLKNWLFERRRKY